MFYVLAISVMLMTTPWQSIGESGGSVTGSPFVRTFTAVGIPYAAGAMNLVVISAALSSANSTPRVVSPVYATRPPYRRVRR